MYAKKEAENVLIFDVKDLPYFFGKFISSLLYTGF